VSGQATALQRAEFNLAQVRAAFQNFEGFESFKTIRSLESEVESTKITLAFQTLRLRAEEARLAPLEHQIALCTIRAPHDGQVILAHKPKRGLTIQMAGRGQRMCGRCALVVHQRVRRNRSLLAIVWRSFRDPRPIGKALRSAVERGCQAR
jgi:hypothetical protein